MSQSMDQPHVPLDPRSITRDAWDAYRDAWRDYWLAQGQPWRTEPEIDFERQKYLNEHRVVMPDAKRGIYPFKDVTLSRSDIEWLLALYEEDNGELNWIHERQW